MTVSFDAFGSNTASGYSNSFTFTPSGTPRGVAVFIHTSGDDPASGVTYGGVPLEFVGYVDGASGDLGDARTELWFLGAGVPTGPQTIVAADLIPGNPTITVYSVAAASDTKVIDFDSIVSGSVANPSVVLALGGATAFSALSGLSGRDDVGSVTPFADWTSRQEEDYGALVQLSYSYDTIGTADITAGWTQAADAAIAIAVAIGEAQVSGGSIAHILAGYQQMIGNA